MKLYNLHFLDRLDFVILSRTVVSADDLGALAEAERWCGTHVIEVWEGERRVARIKKGNAPITAEDRIGDDSQP